MIPSVVLAMFGLISVSNAAIASGPLSADDIIVLGNDGTSRIMKAADFHALETRGAAPRTSGVQQISNPVLHRRGCEKSTEVQILSDEQFLNWDIAISPVISSVGGKGSVTVSSGYEISNSVSVGSEISVSAAKEILGLSLSVEVSESWTTSQEQSLTFEVPDGHHGVIVSEPYVRRVQGNVLDGCTDSWEKSSFVSDSYESQNYGNLNWVKGVIRLCSSETYPIPYCIGEGSHK
ncbi:hypothetical protein BGZ61DRAFT_538585 [Ilyonectria robusta]|uniref:uncharacterized protein n=1 Tax=Ilyonectria robusta TaxID=1079257 RepID=UPI001E8E9589|nr:uncharacterized protein BGZ61DRAFT_538585 [Ilyonectria robusta]KAH8665621.1 hypothetical protein BGZ61DRAFT_538585 [Ilyonectria robusta]